MENREPFEVKKGQAGDEGEYKEAGNQEQVPDHGDGFYVTTIESTTGVSAFLTMVGIKLVASKR